MCANPDPFRRLDPSLLHIEACCTNLACHIAGSKLNIYVFIKDVVLELVINDKYFLKTLAILKEYIINTSVIQVLDRSTTTDPHCRN